VSIANIFTYLFFIKFSPPKISCDNDAETNPMSLLWAKHEKTNIVATIDTLNQTSSNQKHQLTLLVYKIECLIGDWNKEQVRFKLKEGNEPFQLPPFSVTKMHEDTEYQFIIPKKTGTVRVVSDFRIVNSKLQRVFFLIPKMQDILTSLNGFNYATSIEVNMSHSTIRLTPHAQKLFRKSFLGGNAPIYNYSWELQTHQIFFKVKYPN
jgi:hypothetical protein